MGAGKKHLDHPLVERRSPERTTRTPVMSPPLTTMLAGPPLTEVPGLVMVHSLPASVTVTERLKFWAVT